MKLLCGYGGFAAAVNSRIAALAALVLLLAALPAHAQSEPVKLAILGDSLAAGYGLAPAQAFPARLQAALKEKGRNVTVINHGVSGDTTAGGVERLDWMLGDKPDIVLVELGGNDALRAVDPAATERNLDAIVKKLKEAGVTVWLAGMLAPRNFGPEYAQAFDALFKKVADKYEVPLYAFFLDGVAQDPALNQPDGIHPNARGVDVIVERILPFVTKNLDAAPVRRPARP
ncbi:MAG: arylesterase [Reyranella sp.]|jgi:acyl-CoA thioesterase I|nr:arylesterase [Reyranella sp.]